MARISLDPPRSFAQRMGAWYTKRTTGHAFDPLNAVAHNKTVLWTLLRFEQRVAKWRTLDPALKHLALMVSAANIGCAWCVDYGYWEAEELGIPAAKVRAVSEWRTTPEPFTSTELLVLEFAEAATATPAAVTDDLAAQLIDRLGEAGYVELTTIVAVENLRSRMNSAFGLTGQGFSASCAVRPPHIPAH